MFFKKKKTQKKESASRVLPEADISDFVPPVDPAVDSIKNNDVSMLKNLQSELIKSGVIAEEREALETDIQGLNEVLDIMRDANENAKTEKDFNTEYYNEETNNFFETDEELQLRQDYENQLLDGFDDFGNKVYDDDTNKRFI